MLTNTSTSWHQLQYIKKQTAPLELNDSITETQEPKTIAKYYGKKCKQINEELQIQGKRNKKIVILRNGSCDNLSPINIDGNRVTAIYTCAFDSVYHLLAAAVCDWPQFRVKVEQQRISNGMFDFTLKTLDKGITAASYRNRAKFHYDFIEHKPQPDGSILLECETTVENIITKMFQDTPSIVITIKCNTCQQKRQRNVIAPVIYSSNMSQDEIDLSSLENLSMRTPCNAKECKGLTETSISSLGSAVIFEVFDEGTNKKIKLNSLPRSLKNTGNMKDIYKLVGAVDFMPPAVNLRSSSDVSDNATVPIVYYPAEEDEHVREVARELRRRLCVRVAPLTRAALMRAVRGAGCAFLFLDYDMWAGAGAAACPVPDLDDSLAVRAVDLNVVTSYAPHFYDAVYNFTPPVESLRTILRYEADEGLEIRAAACKWALENDDTFSRWITEDKMTYRVLVVFCEDDPHYERYSRLLAAVGAESNDSDYAIIWRKYKTACPKSEVDRIVVENSRTIIGKTTIGVVTVGAGGSEEAARLRLPLLRCDVPDEPGAAWTSAGRVHPLAAALAALAAEARWRRLAVLTDAGEPLARAWLDALSEHGSLALGRFDVSSGQAGPDRASVDRALADVRRADGRIVFVNARADVAAAILLIATNDSMTRENEYAWIVREWDPTARAGDFDVIAISHWYGNESEPNDGGGLPKLEKKLRDLWSEVGQPPPPLAVPLADAALTMLSGFRRLLRQLSQRVLYDLHTDEAYRKFDEVLGNGSSGPGVMRELRYDARSRALADPVVVVDRCRGGRVTRLGACRARRPCVLRLASPLPADGAACLVRSSGGDFAAACLDLTCGAALAALALAVGTALLARRALRRHLARRDRAVLLQLLARRERAAAALAVHLVPRAALELRDELGAGRFGRVRCAVLRARPGAPRVVAAKALREGAAPAEESEFLREACTLAALDHEHVVRLVGVCADDGPPLVLMEHAFFGDLLRYLRARRPLLRAAASGVDEAAHVAPEALTRLAREAASALGYLVLRGIVHRDVRAANCLVDARRSLKLADFGMARETEAGADGGAEYACRRRGLFPVLWMAPESLTRGVFSAASDVWALGVLVLELVTLGERPFGDVSPLRVLQHVGGGGRPPLPLDATPQTRGLALACWRREAEQRPSAAEVVAYLAAHPRALCAPSPELTDADSGYGEPSSPDPLARDSLAHELLARDPLAHDEGPADSPEHFGL